MSVESFETSHNDYWMWSGRETDASMFEVEENFYNSKFGSEIENLPSAKQSIETWLKMLENEIEEKQFDNHYHTIKQKLEMELRQMEYELGISADGYKDMPCTSAYTMESPSFQLAQAVRLIPTNGKVNVWGRDQIYENSSSAALEHEDELSAGKFTTFPDTPDMGHMNELQSEDGDVLTSMSEDVVRDLFELCYPNDIRNEHEDSDWVYKDMGQVDSFNLLRWAKTIDHQKFKAELFKTELCRSWVKYGLCPYRENCRFAHGRAQLRMRPKLHWKYKTELCKKFLAGYCPYGSRCNFIHMTNDWRRALSRMRRSVRTATDFVQTRERYNRITHRNPIPTMDLEQAFDRMIRLNE